MRTQLFNIVEMLLVKNNIRLHTDELKLQISSHPSYPSLHAVTGVFHHFGISNLAIKVPVTEEVLDELPTTFIAHVTKDNKDDLVLVEKLKHKVKITADKNLSERVDRSTFFNIWDGIIVAVEKDKKINESKSSPVKKALNWFLVSIGLLSTTYFLYNLNELFDQSHFTLSIVGFALSIFIIRHELGISSNVVNSICNISSETSCEASFNSKGAKLFNWIKLSDACLVTFSSYLIYWILFSNQSHNALILCTLIALPFTLYSLYYQYFTVKKWCPLCLAIVGVLWMQAAVIFYSPFSFQSLHLDDWLASLLLVTVGIISIGCWSFIRPLLVRNLALEKLEIDHYRFKRNFEIFNTLYQNEKNLTTSKTSIEGEIILGNEDAPLEIVLVTSPLCLYCKQAHKDILQILQGANDNIRVVIRFNVDVQNKDSQLYQITSSLLDGFHSQHQLKREQLLEEVFDEEVNLSQWLANNKVITHSKYDSILEKQRAWCIENKINFTPALFVNGRQYPQEYERGDLVFFIEELVEQVEIENTLKSELNFTR